MFASHIAAWGVLSTALWAAFCLVRRAAARPVLHAQRGVVVFASLFAAPPEVAALPRFGRG